MHRPFSHGELGLTAGHSGRQGAERGFVVVQVDNDKRAVGVLGLGGADKTPERGVTQVARRRRLARAARRMRRRVSKTSGMSPVVSSGQPGLQQYQPSARGIMGRLDELACTGGHPRDDHDLGHTTVLPDSGMERGQVGVAFDLDCRLRERCAEA
jgi:hypothetical protein